MNKWLVGKANRFADTYFQVRLQTDLSSMVISLRLLAEKNYLMPLYLLDIFFLSPFIYLTLYAQKCTETAFSTN